MWYAENTTILFQTDTAKIGSSQNELINMRVNPELTILKDQNVTSRIFGIPIGWADTIIKKLIWVPASNTNVDYKVPLAPNFNRTSIILNLEFQFTERIYEF